MSTTYLRYAVVFAAGLSMHEAQAGIPVWTFSAPNPSTLNVFTNGSSTVQYTVTNQSSKAKNLLLQTTPGLSASPCYLPTKGSTCNLIITVNPNDVTSAGIHGGPIMCESGNPQQCYQPSKENVLNVTLGTAAYITDFSSNLWQCPMTTTGTFAGDACIALKNSTPPGFSHTNVASSASFSNTIYVYVGDDSDILWQCPITAAGGIANGACIALTNSPTPFVNTIAATFATFAGITYAYVGDASSNLWQCPMTAAGGIVGGTCTALTNSTPPGFQPVDTTFATFSGITYAYVTSQNSPNLWQCPMTSTGSIAGGACTLLTNATAPGFFSGSVVTFANFSGVRYAYVADASSNLWKCTMTATGGISGGACTALTNSTPPGFFETADVTFATFAGTTYGYVTDASHNFWQCPMTATGDIAGGACIALTNLTAPGFAFSSAAIFLGAVGKI